MNLGTHMPDGERRKPIDIEVCRSKVKVTTSKNRTKIWYFFCFRTISQVQETKYTYASCWEEQVSWTWGLWVKGQDHNFQNYITRHCPSICSQLSFRTLGALLIFINSRGKILSEKCIVMWLFPFLI